MSKFINPTFGTMSLFLVVLNDPNEDVESRIEKLDNSHKYLDNVYLVVDDTTPMRLANKIGIKGENRVSDATGVVFKLNGSYSGYTSRSLWDYLSQTEQ